MISLHRYGAVFAVKIIFFGFVSSEPDEDGYDISRLFNEELIIPDVIPVPPPARARIYYPCREILPGGNLTYNESSFPPVKVTWPYEEEALYTLFLTGITDWNRAINRKQPIKGKEWHQWLVSNIPGNNISAGNVDCDHLLAEDTGMEGMYDLMLTLVYKQRGPIKIDVDIEPGWIEFQRNFKPHRFARQYGLGQPIAGSYHFICYEHYKG